MKKISLFKTKIIINPVSFIAGIRISVTGILLLFFLINSSFAQTGIIRGNLYDEESGENLPYALVRLISTDYETISDINGFFTFSGLAEGEYLVEASYLSYDTLTISISLEHGQSVYQALFLAPVGVELGVIDISSKREKYRSEINISELSISAEELRIVPAFGAETDLAQYMQIIPGVISTGDQGGQLFVRGGSPVQNLVLLDGITIHNPFHSIGGISVFDDNIIQNVEVHTGAFNAQYGGRISSVIDVKTRTGNNTRYSGSLSASPFAIKASVEGPIISRKESGESVSFIFSSKNSVIEHTSKSIYDYVTPDDTTGLPFSYADHYGKLSFITGNGGRISLFGFNFQDSYNDPNIALIDWKNVGGGLNFRLVPSNSGFIINGKAGYSNYITSIDEGSNKNRMSGIKNFSTAIDFNSYGSLTEISYGFELQSLRTDFMFTNPFLINVSQFQNTTEVSSFMTLQRKFDRFLIKPGLRIQYYASQSTFSIEPRVGVKYLVNSVLRMKAAAGIYSQNLLSASNERDVVQLFSGFLSSPESQIFDKDGNLLNQNLQKNWQLVSGVELDIGTGLLINVEGYIKNFDPIIVLNRNRLTLSDPEFIVETGKAKGLDFSIRYNSKAIDCFVGYSYAEVFRDDGEQSYSAVNDRRHNLNFVSSYNFGHSGDWKLHLRWNYGSGFPFTQTQGFFNYNPFFDSTNTDYVTDNPVEPGIVYANERNSASLPSYNRVDLSFEKRINFTKFTQLDLILSVINLLNRKNIFYFDRLRYERVDQLPALASLGIRLSI